MKETLEREVKLTPPARFRLPELAGEAFPERVFTSTYVDTADLRLARGGVTLRRRVEKAKGLWQLKLPRGMARLELELPGGAKVPPPEIQDLVYALARGGELAPVAKLRTRRSGVLVQEAGEVAAEVAVDSVSVMANGRVQTGFKELEVELVAGGEKLLRRLERDLRRAGAGDGDPRPKVFKALGIEPEPPPPAPPPEAPAGDHLAAALRAQYANVLAHDPGTRLGADPEELHQLRVATRRLRAFLRAARSLLDTEWSEGLRAELAWLGGALGPVRDLDVLIEHLRADEASLERGEQRSLERLFSALETEREADRAVLAEAMRSERYLRLLDALEDAAAAPRLVPSESSLAAIAAVEFRRLEKAVKALDREPTDEELHAVRLRGKRARYAAELAEPVVGRRATTFIERAKAFQDVIGEHQDAVVAEQRIRELLTRYGGARLGFAAGRLVERQMGRRASARAAFPDAWAELRKAGKKAWQ